LVPQLRFFDLGILRRQQGRRFLILLLEPIDFGEFRLFPLLLFCCQRLDFRLSRSQLLL